VAICTNCGRESEGTFAFCPHCGAQLTNARASREQRKTVTVLFCDVTGSTALGESSDPEALRALLARYFERMKGIVESHGGTVEKFIGDAVMAVFGVPQVHEDDALRACRAAIEMRDALPELGVQARIGLNTGEVVTGTQERLATGDAVNVAARLEQAAQPGEILLGSDTLALVRDAVEAETVEPLELKGKEEPIPAHRLQAAHEAPERLHEVPFVGRARELEMLRQAWQRALDDDQCELVTVVGDAGLGKSRLEIEFVSSVGARAVGGRCLPYGEGITYWPVVEVIKQLDALPSHPAAAASIRSLLRESERATSPEEIAWAFRKLLEEQGPLIVVFDDIQWGAETFLDLIEHLALLSSGAPTLLVCMARPELLERRSAWPITLRLAPLGDSDVDHLIPRRFGGQQREKIARAAGGNPLFIAEMLAMSEGGNGEVAVPPTLQALLAARLDQLEVPERRVLECAAVEGEVFHRGAIQALAPDVPQVTTRLAALVRREFVRTDRTQIPDDDGFRFRHLLIRDATYDAVPKANRAELHERLATWLEDRGQNRVELDEIVGFHLEQAARYRAELGQPDQGLAERAGKHLAVAGRRALWRIDVHAASPLLERALKLTRPYLLDLQLELDLANAVRTDSTRAEAIALAAAEKAREIGDPTGETLATLVALEHHMDVDSEPDAARLEALARTVLEPLELLEDHAGLYRVWRALGTVANINQRYDEAAQATEHALRHARLAGWQLPSLVFLGDALVQGPRPADAALQTLDAALPQSPSPGILQTRAWLLAMLNRFDEAEPMARSAGERVREQVGDYGGEIPLAAVETLAGNHESAARYLQKLCDVLEARGQRAYLSTYAPMLGRSLCALGRYDEAEPLARLGRELGGEQDHATQTLWRQVQALVDAYRGDHSHAERLAREAVEISERTDALNWQGDAFCDLAEVLTAAGRIDDAVAALEQALERYERKKNLAMVAQVQPRLEALRDPASA
jgi:class 3 adenylate cyclase/tetratricopeptide (TPR) repeat protein